MLLISPVCVHMLYFHVCLLFHAHNIHNVNVQGSSGSSELVAVGDQAMPAGLVELQQKLKYVERTVIHVWACTSVILCACMCIVMWYRQSTQILL